MANDTLMKWYYAPANAIIYAICRLRMIQAYERGLANKYTKFAATFAEYDNFWRSYLQSYLNLTCILFENWDYTSFWAL